MELKDRVAIITGGSRGIGKGIALSCAEEGASVVINYQSNKESALKTAKEINNIGGKAIVFKADITNKLEVINMVNKTIEKFGTIDILVNNAGVHDFDNFLSSNAEKILKKMVDTHLYGSFYCTQAVIKEMKKNKRGDIIFITSLAEKQFMQEEWAYTSAKTAVSTMAQCIAKELRWDGIRVNCIAPTIVESDMGLKSVAEWANTKNHTELYKKVPFNRLVKPKDIGNLCVFLASDKASHISGQVIYLDSAIGPNSMRDIVQNKNI